MKYQIKPLEWERDGDVRYAYTIYGHYVLYDGGNLHLHLKGGGGDFWRGVNEDAAEKDYHKKIKEHLIEVK